MIFPMLSFELVEETVESAAEELADALNVEMASAVEDAAWIVAEEARANHPYQNRSGELEASTRVDPVFGDFMREGVSADVVADTAYAAYVNDRPEFEFLEPAAERMKSRIEARMQHGVDQAIVRAGWKK